MLDGVLNECDKAIKTKQSSLLVSLFPFHPLNQIKVLEEEQEAVSQLYNLIDMYSVPTTPEDFATFATLQPSINSLHNIIDEAAAERYSNMDKFCSSLQTDIKELKHEVKEIRLKSQVC